MDDIQSWWEVPSIAHFCSLFRAAFNLLDFDIEELEEALLTDGAEDSGSSLLQELMVRLLAGCVPSAQGCISISNYQMFLRRLFRQKCKEYGRDNPFNTDIDFQFLPLRSKVEILHALCDFRLDADDVQDLLKNLESDSLRVEPLGHDEGNSAYWYFYGTRLYREDYPKVKKSVQDRKRKVRDDKRKRMRRKKKKGAADEDEDVVSDGEGDEALLRVGTGDGAKWQVVCYSEGDWEALTERLHGSSSAEERALHRTLAEDFLPEIPRLFAEKERLQRKRLQESQPRRTSGRIEKLKKQQQKEAALLEEEEKLMGKGNANKGMMAKLLEESFAQMESERSERAGSEDDDEEEEDDYEYRKAKEEEEERVYQSFLAREERVTRAFLKSLSDVPSEKIVLGAHLQGEEGGTSESSSEDVSERGRRRKSPRVKRRDRHKSGRRGGGGRASALSGGGGKGEAVSKDGLPVGRQTNNSLSSATGPIIIQTSRRKLKTSQVRFRQSDEDLQTGLHKILERVKSHEDAWPFADPVDEEWAPRYYAVVRKPMHLRRMEEKLEAGDYLSFSHFKADFMLIVDNCRKYNGSDNEYTEMVENLREVFQRAADRYLESDLSSDEDAAVDFPPPAGAVPGSLPGAEGGAVGEEKEVASYTPRVKRETVVIKQEEPEEEEDEEGEEEEEDEEPVVEKKVVEEKKQKKQKHQPPAVKEEPAESVGGGGRRRKRGKGGEGASEGVVSGGRRSKVPPSTVVEDVSSQLDDEVVIKAEEKVACKEREMAMAERREERREEKRRQEKKREERRRGKEVGSGEEGGGRKGGVSGSSEEGGGRRGGKVDKAKGKVGKEEEADEGEAAEEERYGSHRKRRKKVTTEVVGEEGSEKRRKVGRGRRGVAASVEDSEEGAARVKEETEVEEEEEEKRGAASSAASQGTATEEEGEEEGGAAATSTKKKDSNKKSKSKPKKQTGVVRNAAAINALAEATEQTLKDINKWLDDTPRFSEFSSASNSPSHILSAEEFEHVGKGIESDYRRSLRMSSDPLTSDVQQKDNSKKDASQSGADRKGIKVDKRKPNQGAIGAAPVPVPKRTIIERLQPGKSKGNLLKQARPSSSEAEGSAGGSGSVATGSVAVPFSAKLSETTPKLSLGSVLRGDIAFGEVAKKDSDEGVEEGEEEEKVLPVGTSTSKEKVEEEKAEVTESVEEEKPAKVKIGCPTPNLSAWFKAFGAPKGQGQKKKGAEETKGGSIVEEAVKPIPKPEVAKVLEEPKKAFLQEEEVGVLGKGDPEPLSPSPSGTPHSTSGRQRHVSTGSSNVSDLSSAFSPEVVDPALSPRLVELPSHSPSASSVVPPQPIPFPPVNGTIRVGFYQDTSQKSVGSVGSSGGGEEASPTHTPSSTVPLPQSSAPLQSSSSDMQFYDTSKPLTDQYREVAARVQHQRPASSPPAASSSPSPPPPQSVSPTRQKSYPATTPSVIFSTISGGAPSSSTYPSPVIYPPVTSSVTSLYGPPSSTSAASSPYPDSGASTSFPVKKRLYVGATVSSAATGTTTQPPEVAVTSVLVAPTCSSPVGRSYHSTEPQIAMVHHAPGGLVLPSSPPPYVAPGSLPGYPHAHLQSLQSPAGFQRLPIPYHHHSELSQHHPQHPEKPEPVRSVLHHPPHSHPPHAAELRPGSPSRLAEPSVCEDSVERQRRVLELERTLPGLSQQPAPTRASKLKASHNSESARDSQQPQQPPALARRSELTQLHPQHPEKPEPVRSVLHHPPHSTELRTGSMSRSVESSVCEDAEQQRRVMDLIRNLPGLPQQPAPTRASKTKAAHSSKSARGGSQQSQQPPASSRQLEKPPSEGQTAPSSGFQQFRKSPETGVAGLQQQQPSSAFEFTAASLAFEKDFHSHHHYLSTLPPGSGYFVDPSGMVKAPTTQQQQQAPVGSALPSYPFPLSPHYPHYHAPHHHHHHHHLDATKSQFVPSSSPPTPPLSTSSPTTASSPSPTTSKPSITAPAPSIPPPPSLLPPSNPSSFHPPSGLSSLAHRAFVPPPGNGHRSSGSSGSGMLAFAQSGRQPREGSSRSSGNIMAGSPATFGVDPSNPLYHHHQQYHAHHLHPPSSHPHIPQEELLLRGTAPPLPPSAYPSGYQHAFDAINRPSWL